ncbi:MAG: right-handed parallel beta-helix repeat-containing protein [Bacteroidales bacterium]|jgi:polygalacturonase|nr:right-handed parallel beta-helix repeat-containing protein [Bacteroidales bacterium]
MKKSVFLLIAFSFFANASAQITPNPWLKAEDLVKSVESSVYAKTITISTQNIGNATKAINDAIEACNKAGGGKVIIPKGEFLTGQIVLLSHVNLLLHEGAVLKYSAELNDERANQTAKTLIYVGKQTNAAVTGKGLLAGSINTGCYLQDSKNIIIEVCRFQTSGNEGLYIESCENVIVRGSTIKNGKDGIVISSNSLQDCRNIFVDNFNMNSPNLICAICIKSGVNANLIENIFVRNVKINACAETAVRMDIAEPDKSTKSKDKYVIRSVNFDQITSKSSRYGLVIDGSENRRAAQIMIKNSTFEGLKEPGMNNINADNVTFQNVTMTNDAGFKTSATFREMTSDQRKTLIEQRRKELQERRDQPRQSTQR